MIVGVFSPLINWCGGAEWVAINVINTLKEQGHSVVLLTNKLLDQEKISRIFNTKISVDQQIVFPFAFFSPSNYHNIYTDCFRSFLLKLKCDLMIDTYSNAILPGMDVAYIHYPLIGLLRNRSNLLRNKLFYYPYCKFLESTKNNLNKKVFIVNSEFTAKAVKETFNASSYVLYPPVSNEILTHNEIEMNRRRDNNVLTISRISREKNLWLIPYIAQNTRKDISFTIAGLMDSTDVLDSLLELIRRLGVTNKVNIVPNLTRDNLRELMLNSKVYLHTKVNEHFGVSIVEAMASGCIPLVHDSGGAKEFVLPEYRYRNMEEAAEKVEKAIDSWSTSQAVTMWQSVQRFSEKYFSHKLLKIIKLHFPR